MHDDAVVLGWLVGSIDLEGLAAMRPEIDRESVERLKSQVDAAQTDPAQGENLILSCDASVVGAPGPAGIGALLVTDEGSIRAAIAESIGESNVNVAEARAVLRGVIEARRFSPRHLSIRTDSELLVRQLGAAVAIRRPELREVHDRLRVELEGVEGWEVQAVGRTENSAAHALARIGLERG